MSNSVITLEDFAMYHELSSEAISEEFVVGTTKQKVSIEDYVKSLLTSGTSTWLFNARYLLKIT